MFIKPKFKSIKKKCAFEGCKEHFIGGVGERQGKYCQEHRKRKYRKIIDKDKIKKKKEEKVDNNINQIIKHPYKSPMIIIGTCQLKGCNKNFDIMLIPNTFTYPKFCDEHRNQFKRERFLSNGKTDNS